MVKNLKTKGEKNPTNDQELNQDLSTGCLRKCPNKKNKLNKKITFIPPKQVYG